MNLEIKAADMLAITGASGSGKSTLLGLLGGLDTPSEGQVILCGENLSELGEGRRAQVRGRFTSFVFQSFQLLPELTALENVLLPLELNGQPNAESRAYYYLDMVGLAERTRHYPNQLSGGEQQRVALARAYVSEPRILLADEPTGNLDSMASTHIADLMFEMHHNSGTTLIIVTHDEGLANRCNSRIRLTDGRMEQL